MNIENITNVERNVISILFGNFLTQNEVDDIIFSSSNILEFENNETAGYFISIKLSNNEILNKFENETVVSTPFMGGYLDDQLYSGYLIFIDKIKNEIILECHNWGIDLPTNFRMNPNIIIKEMEKVNV
jgi:hypothetical protein